jgi:transposase InsO family protein
LAGAEPANLSELCRRFGISRQTGYKWLSRWRTQGAAGLHERSCRPLHSPLKTAAKLEEQVLQVRGCHPAWGARKIAHVLQRDRGVELATSTVNSILRRHGCIEPAASEAATAWQRFEHKLPNELWQMDFKGHFATAAQRCHPLTVLDDHSRYNLVLDAVGRETFEAVQPCLQRAFERYGIPWRINTDNGPPWRAGGQQTVTRLGLWLIRLGIALSNSSPHHPQTNGKDERFHRTFKAEVLGTRAFRDLAHAQRHFNAWRHVYNFQRPHQALLMQTPTQRYHVSPRSMPKVLPPIEYAPGDIVRLVQSGGWISVRGKEFRLSETLRGLPVALRPHPTEDAIYDLYFCHQRLGEVDLNLPC